MSNPSSSESPESRSKILRDVLVFQVKLWLEGFKDVVLMPLSLGAACVDLLFRRSTKRGTLYSVMKVGDRFERWVDLYAAIDEKQGSPPTHRPSLDELMDEAEAGLRTASSSEVRETNPEHERS
jgi:hypothetical protein